MTNLVVFIIGCKKRGNCAEMTKLCVEAKEKMRIILTRFVGTEFFQILVLKDQNVTVPHSPGEHLAQGSISCC